MLPQDTTHLIKRPCYQQGSPCQDPAGNWTRRRPPDNCKETQTAVVWSCFLFIRSGQNNLARHSERGKKTRRTKEEVGRQHQEMDRPGVQQVPEGSGEQGKIEKIIFGAPMTLAVKGLMMMMMITKRIAGLQCLCVIHFCDIFQAVHTERWESVPMFLLSHPNVVGLNHARGVLCFCHTIHSSDCHISVSF